jgi:hypothetical protein
MSQAKSADITLPAAAVPTGGGSSRRALLTAAPAVAAGALLAGTAVNAVAIGLAKAGEAGDDAELLSLKPEVDDVLDEWIRQMKKDCVDHQEFERLHLARFGFEQDDAPEVDWKDPEYLAYDRDLMRLIHEHHSGRSEDELDLNHWGRLYERLYPLAEKALSYRASTVEGLRSKQGRSSSIKMKSGTPQGGALNPRIQ